MKKSRIIFTIIMFITCLITALFSNKVQAAPLTPVRYYGIAELRDTTQMGYAMGNPSQGAEKIWKIVRYSNTSYNDPTEVNVYCIKADQGFSNQSRTEIYDVSYNMKTERTAIAKQNDVLKGLVNGGQYDNLLALADLLYFKDASTLSEREQLLDASGANDVVEKSEFNGVTQYYITDDEIDAVQQAAIWYFTNYQEGGEYDKYGQSAWVWYTSSTDNGQYQSLSSYNPTNMSYASARAGYYRQQQMAKLYDYLIETAKSNASKGVNDEKTILTVYASNSNAEAQPIMEVQKLPKEFDLSLRKYITEINDESVENSRVPVIDESTLKSGTTATYKHRKDPVEVNSNDTITYNITIYNEGEKAGRATKVVDQLPTGLEFVEVVSGNFEKSSYNTQNNTLYLTRKANNTTNLPAYTEGNLSSETIQIKCKVTATGGNTDKVLTNIAWISEEIDEDGNVITNAPGDDRDSEPSTITTQTKDQLVTTDNGYIGNSSNNGKDLTNSQNYFEGQQDDDDFEKVIIRAVTSIDVSKKWDDEENQDGKRVGTVVVELLRNGVATGQTVTLTENNHWSGKFENLPTKIDGKDVTYSVKETTSINGYDTVVSSADGTNGKSFTITNSYTPEETQITATKVWEDNNNQDGKRPPSVEFELYKNGVATGNKKTLTGNNWTATFTGLPVYEGGQKITYTVKEVSVPSGYTSSGDGTEANSYTITNRYTPETTSVSVNKVWEDNNNQDGLRPDEIEVELLKNGQDTGKKVTLNAGNNWRETFGNLPVYENGQKITYTVKEISVDGYEVEINANGEYDFTITNTHIPEVTEITAKKQWNDNNNQDGVRPESVEFELYKNGIATGTKKTLTGNNWTATFDNLPVNENGQKITYTVKEVSVPSGYTESGEGTEANSYTITNSYTPDTTQITATKVWEDNNNQDGKRPPSVEFELYKNGKATGNKQTISGDNWKATFTDLPVYENGQKITYTVKEVNVPEGYTSSGDGTEANQYTITNTHKIFDLSLRKYITKVGNTDINNRNPNISTDSLKTGTTATYNHRKDPVVVKTGDTVIYNLTIYNEGEKAGRATKIVDQLPSGLTYVGLVDDSIFTVETYDVGTNTIYFIRQDSNTDNLNAYNGGTILDSETIQVVCEVTATAGSEDTIFTNVAWISEEYDAEDDKIITTEENADTDSEPGTTPEVNKDDLVTTDDGYIGNENNQGKDLSSNEEYFEGEQDDDDFEKIILEAITQVQVNKVWNDNNNQDGLRPEDIQVELLKNGEETGNTVTLNDGNRWTATFENLPVKENGEKITYTVSEIKVNGYAVNITQNGENNFTITNTHTPGVTSVSVNKVWDDKDNQDGLRSESVVIELLKNGESLDPQQTVTLSEENHWTGTFNNLPIKENGVEVEYTVREITKIEGYETTIVDDSTGEEINNELASVNGETTIATYATRSMVRATSENVEPKNFTVTNTHIVEEEFDLALRKFIVAVSGDETIEDSEILKTEDGTAYAREPIVDASKLNTTDEDGNKITTAIYNHTKEPVLVKKNDIVVYMLRVYNEGEQDGYAAEIKDYLPPYLEFVDGEFNSQYGWEVSEDGRTVTTRYLENSLITKPQINDNGNTTLSYEQVPIMCKVLGNAISNENITNMADITEYQDKDKQPVEDRDSEEDNVEVPNDEELPGYKDDEINQDYVPGQEDDDDFEKVYVQDFDLALRKFISEVDGTQYNRVPNVDLSGLQQGTTAIYNHTKDPVLVKRNSVIIYTIRVYNEGEIDGYADQVTDYLPKELEFLPEHEINVMKLMFNMNGKYQKTEEL